ncbi:MAG: putative toxin-antitoxin system toxin component, PIN family [Phycisphaerae bacterium]|nr:putative toxin-antitoxin system toxin component, PIN family [Saprospiraceae bacterium]
MKVVLDTNVLLVAISPKSKNRWLFDALLNGNYTLCVTSDILDEYAEIIEREMGAEVADMTLDLLLMLPNIQLIHKYFFWQLIEHDPDDNKFVDCAIAASAQYLVSEDRHFQVLKKYGYLGIALVKLEEFRGVLNIANLA